MMRIGAADYGRILLNLRGISAAATSSARRATDSFPDAQNSRSFAFGEPLSTAVNGQRVASASASATQATASPRDAASRIYTLLNDIRRLASEAAARGIDPTSQGTTAGTAPAIVSHETRTHLSTTNAISGVNNSQIVAAHIGRLPPHSVVTIHGNVTRAAGSAQLIVRGDERGAAAAGGTYEVAGNRGSTIVAFVAGESLRDVAARINGQTGATGAKAEVVGSDLVVSSIDVGSAASVHVQAIQPEFVTSVGGVNAAQISTFHIGSLTDGTAETISGSLVSTAQSAELVYHGADGAAIGMTSFRLLGSRGSVDVQLVTGEALAAVADRINEATSATGIVASVTGDDLRLTSDSKGTNATVQIDSVERTYDQVVAGLNVAQVSDFSVTSLDDESTHTLSGEVIRSASAATLVLQGSADGKVIDSATFQLSGSLGAATLSIDQGESLAAVADRVNAVADSTGVTAGVSNNQLVFSTSEIGSNAHAEIELTHVDHTNVVSGVNNQQLASFQVNAFAEGQTQTLSGTVIRAASQATLALQGSAGGTVIDSATFQLTGGLGTATVAITQGESLSAVASRVNALTDSTGVVASVSGTQLLFKSSDVGSAAHEQVQLTHVNHTNVVSGVNSQQLSGFQVSTFTEGASQTFTGSVTQAATQAILALQGSASGTVIDTATFQLTGGLGTASVSITQGESLSTVASRVNTFTGTTGVVASVSGTQLLFKSTDVGSAAHAQVQLTHVNHTSIVSGVNSQQLSAFQVNTFTEGASQTLNGSVTQTAGVAELTFTGSLGFVATTATFTLTGSQGSAQISVTPFESLSALATAVNAKTATTGVTAVVQGQQVKFRSVGVGSAATAAIQVTAGTFSVTGGNGNGTANGTNAVAIINGQTLTGSGNQFTFSDSKGSYSFTTASGFTGAISPVSIVSQAGSFAVSGGDANGIATGTNATAVINGQSLTGTGNQFTFSDSNGSYAFTVASGFTGAISSISVVSQAGSFAISGGNGDSTANGTDATAVINGQSLTGSANQFTFADAKGDYSFIIRDGFAGAISPVSIVSQAGSFDLSGGNGDGTATGLDALAVINGSNLTGTKNRFTYGEAGGQFELEFAPGFTGQLDSISANSVAQPFDVTGGNGAGLSVGADAVAVFNGIEQTSADQRFSIVGTHGTYEIEFAPGFTGDFDQVTVASTSRQLQIDGGAQPGLAFGNDAQAVINGRLLRGDKSRFQFTEAGQPATVEFFPDFVGQFDPITIYAHTRHIAAADFKAPQSVRSPFVEVTQGTTAFVPGSPLDSLLGELNELASIAEAAAHSNRAADSLARSEITSQAFELLTHEGPLAAFLGSDPRQAGVIQQLRHAVDLLA